MHSAPTTPPFFHLLPRTTLSGPLLMSLALYNLLGCLVFGIASDGDECSRLRDREHGTLHRSGKAHRVCLHREHVRSYACATLTSLSSVVVADLGIVVWLVGLLVLYVVYWVGTRATRRPRPSLHPPARTRHTRCTRFVALALASLTIGTAIASLALALVAADASSDAVLTALLLLVGAELGTRVRVTLGSWLNGSWPWGTVIANMAGTAVAAVLTTPAAARLSVSLTLALSLGFAGSLTTMSSHVASLAGAASANAPGKLALLLLQTFIPCHLVLYLVRWLAAV